MSFILERRSAGLLIVDVQERLLPVVERSCEVWQQIARAVKGFQILELPIEVSEQYPKGLGQTVAPLRALLGEKQSYFEKTTFSAGKNEKLKERSQWVLAGLEAHVCVLQTARDLVHAGMQVVVLNDAISSRSIYDFSTAVAELRDMGVRISSTETVLFELLKDSKAPEFKQMSALIKGETLGSCCNTCSC